LHQAALKLKADFTGLISDVKTFRDKFVVKQNFGAVRQSENEAKIAELNIKVTELQKELDRYEDALHLVNRLLTNSTVSM